MVNWEYHYWLLFCLECHDLLFYMEGDFHYDM